MRILLDARQLLEAQPTGVSVYVFELLNALFQLDNTNEYFLYYNCAKNSVATRMPKWKQPNVHLVRTRWPSKLLNATMLFFGWPMIDALVQKYVDKPMDMVVSLNPHFTALSSDVPFLLAVHDVSNAVDPYFFSSYERLWHRLVQLPKLLTRATHIFAVSHSTAKDVRELYNVPPEKISVLYPGIPPTTGSCAQNPCSFVQHKKYIVMIGTRARRKNIVNALRAFAIVHEQFPDTTLVLVGGEGYGWDEGAAVLKKIGIEKHIRIVGYTDVRTKEEWLRHATVCLYPSFYEGFGLPILEALRENVPVVTSLGSSLHEAGGDAALYCNPWRPDMIAHAIISLFTDETLRAKLIEQGVQHRALFSWKKSAQTLLTAIETYAHRH